MDNAAMYTAGESLNAGVSPYINFIGREPPIWDGVDVMRHSRFLYPPLAAAMFRPMAAIPYRASKIVWTCLSLAAAIVGFILTLRLLRPISVDAILIAGVVAVFFQPLLCCLERGQTDCLTGAMILGGSCCASRKLSRPLQGGFWLALATILKLHVAYILPVHLLRGQRSQVLSYAAWGAILLLALLPFCGFHNVRDYLGTEFTRISQYGEGGTKEMLLDPTSLKLQPPGMKGGRQYIVDSLQFESNATLVRPIVNRLGGMNHRMSYGALSAILYFLAFIATGVALRRVVPVLESDVLRHISFWYLMSTLVLLVAPLTWSMNVVWLMPVPLVFLAWRARCAHLGWGGLISVAIGAVGVFWIAVPDFNWYLPTTRVVNLATSRKYLIGEVLIATALTSLLRLRESPEFGNALIWICRGRLARASTQSTPLELPLMSWNLALRPSYAGSRS